MYSYGPPLPSSHLFTLSSLPPRPSLHTKHTNHFPRSFSLKHFTPVALIHLPSRGVCQELRVQQGIPGARIRTIKETERQQQDENEAHGGPGQDVYLGREKEREGRRGKTKTAQNVHG